MSEPPLQVDATSRAIGTGKRLGPVRDGRVDFAGNPRVKGAAIDIGAYER